MNSNQLIRAAEDIGRQLYRDAIWHEGRCNWMSIEYSFEGQAMQQHYQPMAEDIYKGLSGAALFLGALFHATGEAIFRRASLGACRQALRLQQRSPQEYRWSFFRGWPGLTWAACLVSEYCREPSLMEDARRVVEGLLREQPPREKMDCIDGLASGIPALITLDRKLALPGLRNCIASLGEELLAKASASDQGLCWNTGQDGQPLPGFSHGASGLAWCMLELYRYTGANTYRQAAVEALRFEEQLLKEQEEEEPPFIKCDWAHGAAGLGLARLHAYTQGCGELFLESTMGAINKSRKGFGQQRHIEVSACNGAWGLTTLLLMAAEELQEPSFKTQAIDLAEQALQQYEERGRSWWDGNASRGEVPDFMICLSGIGYSLLQLADSQAYPSVLAVGYGAKVGN